MTNNQQANTVMEKLTSAPFVAKVLVSIVSATFSVIMFWVFIDDRYAHASDVRNQGVEVVKEVRRSYQMLRLETTNDTIRALRFRREKQGSLPPIDRVRLEELEHRLQNIHKRLQVLDKP